MAFVKLYLSGGLAIIAGLGILLAPKLTRVILGWYLVIIGIISFFEF